MLSLSHSGQRRVFIRAEPLVLKRSDPPAQETTPFSCRDRMGQHDFVMILLAELRLSLLVLHHEGLEASGHHILHNEPETEPHSRMPRNECNPSCD